MGVRPAQKRIDKWIAKMAGEALSKVSERQLASMTLQVEAEFPIIEKLENEIKTILDDIAAPTLLNPSYLNFGRQVWSYTRRFGGTQLLNVVDVKLNYWVDQGLDRDALERIRESVFVLEPPASP